MAYLCLSQMRDRQMEAKLLPQWGSMWRHWAFCRPKQYLQNYYLYLTAVYMEMNWMKPVTHQDVGLGQALWDAAMLISTNSSRHRGRSRIHIDIPCLDK